jgi:integrase
MSENPEEKKSKARRVGGKRKLAPNKWLLRIFRGYDAEKKRIYYSEIFRGGSKEADDRLMELYNRQKAGLPLKFEPKTFADFFKEWLEEMDNGERRECTIDVYRSNGNLYVLPAFGKFALTDISDVAITRLYKDLRKRKLSQSIVRQVHTLLGSLLKMAAKRDLILQNPMNKVDAPPKPKPNPKAMNSEEVKRYLEAAKSHRWGFMFEFAYYLGARPCEYLGLQWPDLNIKQAEITIQRSLKRRRKGPGWYVTPPKTEKSIRTIPLTPELLERLAEHRRHQLVMKLKAGSAWTDHGFIFTDEIGEPLNEVSVRWVHRKICAAAELPTTFQLKSSRHSCASAMLAAGVDLKTVSERLGHSSIAITADVYTVVTEKKQREASERIAEVFGIGKK